MQIQDQIIKIQNKGLITIPKSFRDDIGLEVNSLARIIKEKGRLILEPVRTLPYSTRSYKDSDIENFFDLDKRETKILKIKELL